MGIRYADKIIAVNRDPEANIFKHSDFGMVMDENGNGGHLYKIKNDVEGTPTAEFKSCNSKLI